jgi:UDP-N-acetylmuramate dehydrogenase
MTMTIEIQENVPLAPMTTFKIGGSAKYLVETRTDEDLRAALDWAREKEVRYAILAGGSNALVSDDGFDGLVIHIASKGFSFADSELAADAGCDLLELIRIASERNLGAWEKLAGIPGSIGGAVRGNAGAFGSEIKDFVHKVSALNTDTGEIREFQNAECAFSYRRSFFKHHPQWIITRIFVQLPQVKPAESAELIEQTIAEREKRHLQNVQAAGSYFMNPYAPQHIQDLFESEKGMKSREGRVPAGWLIEKAGMKGAMVGGAIASLQHPNYIVNTGNATAEDVRKLAIEIKVAVHQHYGVTLTEEAAQL